MGKRNRSFMILGGIAAASALAGTASAFWNFFGPELPNAEVPQSGQSVKADFNNASVDEVFKWLRGQGIEFVVETTQIANRRITMSVTAKNNDALLNAIADALGFSVTKKDGTYVLKQASPFGSLNWQEGDSSPFFQNMKPMTPEEKAKWEKEMGDNFKVFGNLKDMTPEQRAKMEKEMAEGFKSFGDNFKVFGNLKDMTPEEKAKWEKEMAEGFKGFGDTFKMFGDLKDMTPEQRAKMEKEFGAMGENFKMFGGDGKVWENGKQREMTKEEKAKVEKEMKEWGKNFSFEFGKTFMPMLEKELGQVFKDGKVWENGKQREMTKEEKAKLEKEMKELHENLKNLPMVAWPGMSEEERKKFEADMKKFHENMKDMPQFDGKMLFHDGDMTMPHFTITKDSIKELKASLTDKQKDLMKNQGYLKPSDLTDAQKKMLGLDKMEGDFSITLSDDDLTIKIKSK
jgi:hypothetical protein